MAEEKREPTLEEKTGWAYGVVRAWFKNIKRAGLLFPKKEQKIASALTILREFLKEKGIITEQKEEEKK